MSAKETTKSLQVGDVTEETSPVAAIIEMDSMYGLQKFFFQGESPEEIIGGMTKYQDLYCLCRMARNMGTEEDAEVAERLEDFLYDYEIEDFDKFDFPLSIGRIRCLGWAKGEKNCELLKSIHESEKSK